MKTRNLRRLTGVTSQAFATVPLAIVLIVFFTIDGDAETLGWAGAILALFDLLPENWTD